MKLILENVGIFEKAEVDINGLTVIAGNNDTGKSTIGKVAYCLTKAFENFESDYVLSKRERIGEIFEDIERIIVENISLDSELIEYIFGIDRLLSSPFKIEHINSDECKKMTKKIKKYLDKKYKEGEIKERIRNEIGKHFDEIEALYNMEEEKETESKIIYSLEKLFGSEFRRQLTNLLCNESKIQVHEGPNKIIDVGVKNNMIFKNSPEKIKEIFPFKSSVKSSVFIETPFILNYKLGLTITSHHSRDLLNKLINEDRFSMKNRPISDKGLNIGKIIGGEIFYHESLNDFRFQKKTPNSEMQDIDILNSASGIKSFGILQMLIKTGKIGKNTLLIIDEPEVHLHPDWQVKYAKVLVGLVKKGVKVLIASHSPYMIEALNKFSKKEGISDDTKFYLSKSSNDGRTATIKDRTDNKGEIFYKLSHPLKKLIFDD